MSNVIILFRDSSHGKVVGRDPSLSTWTVVLESLMRPNAVATLGTRTHPHTHSLANTHAYVGNTCINWLIMKLIHNLWSPDGHQACWDPTFTSITLAEKAAQNACGWIEGQPYHLRHVCNSFFKKANWRRKTFARRIKQFTLCARI